MRAVGGEGHWGGRGRERRVRRNSSMLESSTASHYRIVEIFLEKKL